MNVVDKNQCSVIIPGWQSIDQVEENVIWFDKSSEPHIKEFNISNFDENAKNIMSNCLAWKHCEDTKIALDDFSEYTCPHLFLKMQKTKLGCDMCIHLCVNPFCFYTFTRY